MRLTGYIYGDNDAFVKGIVTLIDNSTESTQLIEVAAGEKYTIDADAAALADLTAVFSSEGYASKEYNVATLASTDQNIFLDHSKGPITVGLIALAGFGLLAVTKNKKKRVGKLQAADITPFLLIAGGLLAVNAIKKILDKLGLGSDPTAGPQSDPNSPWKPSYYKQFSFYSFAISLEQADAYAETIHNAFGVFQDDFSAVMSVFSNLRTKSNVSFLADIFSRKYDTDLLTFLTDGGGLLPWDGLSKEHLETLIAYVNKLPSN